MTSFYWGVGVGIGLVAIIWILVLEIRLQHVEKQLVTSNFSATSDKIKNQTANLSDDELDGLLNKDIGSKSAGS